MLTRHSSWRPAFPHPRFYNVRLSAVRKLVSEAADNGLLAPDLAASIAKVKGVRRHGVRIGNWLERWQAEQLLHAPDISTMAGKRDRALLAVLIGCGLRRSEAAALTFQHIQQHENRWVIVDLVGKHGRIRSVPMPAWAKLAIGEWSAASGIDMGRVFRPVNRGGRLTHENMKSSTLAKPIPDSGKSGLLILTRPFHWGVSIDQRT